MKYLLLSPRLAVQKGDFLGSGVPYWPIELAILAERLRSSGVSIQVADLFGSDPKHLEEDGGIYWQGRPFNKVEFSDTPDVAIIYAISYMSHAEVTSLVQQVKAKFPSVRVAILENSQAVTAYSLSDVADSLFKAGADHLLCGEVHFNWDQIDAYLQQKSTERPSNVIDAGQPNDPAFKRIFKQPENYPFPAWDLFPFQNYWKLSYSHGPKSRKYFPILTSRGCPYPCSFCVVPTTNEQKFRARKPVDVVSEMRFMSEKFGVSDFQVEDLNPTVKPNRWSEIAKLLIEQNLKVRFGFVSGTKAETIKIEEVELLARGGLKYVSISPESGSARILKDLGKPFDYDHGLKLISECAKYGIFTQACLLVGYPEETEDDHVASVDYLKKMIACGLDEVAVFIVAPFAGSKLFRSGRISMTDSTNLVSFSPKGREDFETVERRRRELVRVFFQQKLKRDLRIWSQGIRSLFGEPKTKMENLPKRIVAVSAFKLRSKIRSLMEL